MDRNKRSRIYLIALFIAIFLVYTYRQNQPKPVALTGTTMGTITYSVKYQDKDQRSFKKEIDSLLRDFNQSLSTYIPNSEISTFNQEGSVQFEYPYFFEVLETSQTVYQKTDGAFDPTVGPLVDAWGFGDGQMIGPDTLQVDSLLQYIGLKKVEYDQAGARSKVKGLKLNFSAIAKGQAIDVVAEYLEAQGKVNYMVEIGGEVRAKGENAEGEIWTIGIETPDENRIGGLYDALYLKDQAMATSGNYRNFRVLDDGRKVAHTIDPTTGFPKMQTLLSATILAPNCMLADAYATACMVLGKDKSIELIENEPDLECYLIFVGEDGETNTYISQGLEGQNIKAQSEE